MNFGPTRTRLTRTSSDLRTLSAILLPPSPILTADGSLICSTSGEIPILLGATVHVCDSPLLTFTEPPGFPDVAKEPKLTDKLYITVGNTRDPSRSNEAFKSDDWMCGESDDMCIRRSAESLSDSYSARAFSGKLENPTHPVDNDVLGSDARCSGIQDDRPTPVFVQQHKEGLRDPRASSPGIMEVNMAVAPKGDLDGDHSLTFATFHTYSTLPTPSSTPPLPSSSADVILLASSPVGRQRHRRPLERARAVRLPGRPRSPRLQVNDVESNLLTDPAPPAVTFSYTADTYVSGAAHPFVKHVVLPEELPWMKHMIIELWIDQEGFRAVRPRLQLMGYSPRTRSLYPYEPAESTGPGITAGVAEFMPTKRETFTFHYATLDSPPVLRMVSVTGDESRDYISRQATLSVKTNGVYTVLGSETFIAATLSNDAHGLRLRWKFDYLVNDRKVDGTGKILPGEKTLTPLTFSCSPYLFHPLQGKKAGLMHIMKKNLVLKLGSQKLEPPTYRPSHSILSQVPLRLLAGESSATH